MLDVVGGGGSGVVVKRGVGNGGSGVILEVVEVAGVVVVEVAGVVVVEVAGVVVVEVAGLVVVMVWVEVVGLYISIERFCMYFIFINSVLLACTCCLLLQCFLCLL